MNKQFNQIDYIEKWQAENTRRMELRMRIADFNALEGYAAATGRAKTDVIRAALAEYYAAHPLPPDAPQKPQ